MAFQKGKRKTGGRTRGVKNKSTVLREEIGYHNWDGLKAFIEGEGATKLVREMKKLKGKGYVQAVQAMAEYVKPKLTRTDAKITGKLNLSELPITFK